MLFAFSDRLLRSSSGYALRQVVLLLSVIGLLLAMLIPSFMGAQINASENRVKTQLRALYEAGEAYYKLQRPAQYPTALVQLSETNPPLIDMTLTSPERGGYRFTYIRKTAEKYELLARPVFKFLTGYHSFYLDETGIIRLNRAEGEPIDA